MVPQVQLQQPSPQIQIQYYGFWNGFYRDSKATAPFRALFEYLFANSTHKNIHIHSVFPENGRPIQRDDNTLAVHYSGEPFFDPPNKFDLSLTMEPDDPTTRNVWCPLFSLGSYEKGYWPLYSIPRPLSLPHKRRFCAFIVSNEKAHIRNRFFQKLHAYKHVDSCGYRMNNCGFQAPFDGYLEFLQQFKFMICFENTSKSHYITEKLHNAYLGGTIPIYWGCPNAQTWFNPKSFLYLPPDANDAAMDQLIARIIELDQDDAKYTEMHQELLLPSSEIPYDMRLETMKNKIQCA